MQEEKQHGPSNVINNAKPKGVKVVDPQSGKEITLEYQRIELHPCEIIAAMPKKFDSTAVEASKAYQDYRRPAAERTNEISYLSVNATRIEGTDLFDPDLLSPFHLKPKSDDNK